MKTSKLSVTLVATALGLSAAVLSAPGCGSNQPVGGLTNPNPNSVFDRDKGATRTDLPVPDANPAGKEPVAEASSTSPSGTGTSAGTGGPGGGQPGTGNGPAAATGPDSEARRSSPEAVSATPNAKENSGQASGGTKPADKIKEGTPRSPQ